MTEDDAEWYISIYRDLPISKLRKHMAHAGVRITADMTIEDILQAAKKKLLTSSPAPPASP